MSMPVTPQNIVSAGLCTGCGNCAALSDALRINFDKYGQLQPTGKLQEEMLPAFRRICPFSPESAGEDLLSADSFPEAQEHHPSTGRFISAWVGHVAEDDFRMQGSSGGMVTWVVTRLLREGLVDGIAHVVPADPRTGCFFRYTVSRDENGIRHGAKSRYYPVEMSAILEDIRAIPGKYAVVGIPCFIKAIQLLRREDPLMRERIRFTVALFCGHMKSARFIESFAWQMKVPANEVSHVDFRYKDPDRPANWYQARLTCRDGREVSRDWWHLADGDWGAGFLMNSACNFCDDVVGETADISAGDAWVEPYSSDGRGSNVVVIRSPLLHRMISSAIDNGTLDLQEVDGEFISGTQAAGLRQRREGLAYRLSWKGWKMLPRKRFKALVPGNVQRRRIYKIRYLISVWSHRVFFISRRLGIHRIYIIWARAAAAVYHGYAYHRGWLGGMIKKFTTGPAENHQ